MGSEQISEKKVDVLLMTRLILAEYNESINTVFNSTIRITSLTFKRTVVNKLHQIVLKNKVIQLYG